MKFKPDSFLFLVIFCFFLAACATPEIKISKDVVYQDPLPKIEYEYLLGPGDIVEIVYHYTPKPDNREYYLAVGDVIKVEFTYHGNTNRQLTVRPDGNIAMPRKGDLHVIGLTPSQLQNKITLLYSDIFKNPVVTITMIQYNRAIDHLKKAITTSPRGQSKLSTIRPDGYLSLPIIDDIKAAGKTIPRLKTIATKEYGKLIRNLTVSLILKKMNANLVYIMGEVKKPDYYLMERPSTVMQMLSKSGGVLNTAEKSTIMVIRRDKQNRPVARLVNLKKIIEQGNIGHDITLVQYDIIYVPKSRIARANLFMDQYINQMIPDMFTANYNMGGVLLRHDPVIK